MGTISNVTIAKSRKEWDWLEGYNCGCGFTTTNINIEGHTHVQAISYQPHYRTETLPNS